MQFTALHSLRSRKSTAAADTAAAAAAAAAEEASFHMNSVPSSLITNE